MRTMYYVNEGVFTGCEGQNIEMENRGQFDTLEEAKKAVADLHHDRDGWFTGNWSIVAKTMDEETFSFTSKIIEYFDWYKEVGKRKYMEEYIQCWTKKIKEIEESKKRCRTEKGIAKKDKEIETLKKWIKEERKKL